MSAEHDTDHGEADEGRGTAEVALVVPGQPAMVADPGDGSLDNPPLGQHDKPVLVAAPHDLEVPRTGPLHGGCHFRSLVSCIADDPRDEREQPARLCQQRLGAVAILYVGGMNHHAQQQPERIRQNVALAPDGLLAGVVARRVERRPPFCAAFAVWLSMIAVVGLASRPTRSRSAIYRAWWMRSIVPSHSHSEK